MKATSMECLKPYKATSSSPDGSIITVQIMWLSQNGDLNLPNKYGGGVLLKEEWTDSSTCDFEVEEAPDYIIEVRPEIESLKRSLIQ